MQAILGINFYLMGVKILCHFKIKPIDFIKEFLSFELNFYDKDKSNSITFRDDLYVENQVHMVNSEGGSIA